MRDLPPVDPGEHLREDVMAPPDLTAERLAQDLDLPVSYIQTIINEQHGIAADTAQRLARYFRTTPAFWLNLQRDNEP
jgi:addiction module HigA family antidote